MFFRPNPTTVFLIKNPWCERTVLRSRLRLVGLAVASTIVFLGACTCTWTWVWQEHRDCKEEWWEYRKAEGGRGICVVMAQWDHYCNAVSTPSLRTDLFLLFLSFTLSFFLLPPFLPIRIFAAFISLALSFSRNFRYASSRGKESFCKTGLCPVTVQRLRGICGIKNLSQDKALGQSATALSTKISLI